MAVTQRSQHRDYLPDVVKAPIEELNDNVAVLGLWDTGCDARHLCAAHTGKQQADFTPIIAAPAVSPFGMPQAPAALRRAVPTRGAFEPTIWHTPSRRLKPRSSVPYLGRTHECKSPGRSAMKYAVLAIMVGLGMTVLGPPAQAAACANGVYRAGCVGPN